MLSIFSTGADNAAPQEALQMDGEAGSVAAAESFSEYAKVNEEETAATEESALIEEEMAEEGSAGRAAGEPSYKDVEAVLTAAFAAGETGGSSAADTEVQDEEIFEFKYRQVAIEDDGDSVSVLIYDKENDGMLVTAFWVQGQYAGVSEKSASGLTLTTIVNVTESDFENGQYVPMYLAPGQEPTRVAPEDITIAPDASRPVYKVYVEMDVESGNYSVRAELG